MDITFNPEHDAVVVDGLEIPVYGTREGLTTAEYGILFDAVERIGRERLLYKGLTGEDADKILALQRDFFAFEAAARPS